MVGIAPAITSNTPSLYSNLPVEGDFLPFSLEVSDNFLTFANATDRNKKM